jgi:hypothetical protein
MGDVVAGHRLHLTMQTKAALGCGAAQQTQRLLLLQAPKQASRMHTLGDSHCAESLCLTHVRPLAPHPHPPPWRAHAPASRVLQVSGPQPAQLQRKVPRAPHTAAAGAATTWPHLLHQA